ncbi:MAG TPA: NAD-dependent dehydratase, partial [Candidatus Bathyarchaeia archaeon]|nr:NAD-dependent dehydratase [Candidatus Bathyarchaeia archaeon]
SGDVVRVPREHMPKHLVRDLDFRHDLALSSRRIRDELGFSERISFEQGLRKTVEWERNNPPEIRHGLFDYEAEDIALRGTAR